jgi:2-polyprenyl-3-methyl-5-hydroxy-6-metoxy-1,4-benzoquinol methylase
MQGFKARAPMLRKIIREHFPKEGSTSILDLGCGHGVFLHFIREAGYTDVSGVDGSPEQVAEAARLGIEGAFEGDLIETLHSLKDQSKDVIIAFDVIEHFTKAELLPFVDEVYRVLRSEGKWIIHTPNGDTPNGESPFGGRMFFGDFTHEMAYTRTSITQLLLASGFSEVICREDTPIAYGLKSVVRWTLWKCFRTALRLYLAAETGSCERECILTQNFLTVAMK